MQADGKTVDATQKTYIGQLSVVAMVTILMALRLMVMMSSIFLKTLKRALKFSGPN
jgi:hypothetical protein